jgi:hypothetical protein
MPDRTPSADRHHGGPGSSHQNADKPLKEEQHGPKPGEPTNPDRSRSQAGAGNGTGATAINRPESPERPGCGTGYSGNVP